MNDTAARWIALTALLSLSCGCLSNTLESGSHDPEHLCSQVLEDWDQRRCLAVVSDQAPGGICEEAITEDFRIMCYTDFALAKKDSDVCAGIDACLRAFAVETGNYSMCLDVSDRAEREPCQRELARRLRDPMLCANISDQEIKQACLISASNDSAICLAATGMDECYSEIAENNNDSAVCEKIGDAGERILCRAKTEKDPSTCSGLSSEESRGRCYSVVGGELGLYELCEKTKNRVARNDCLFSAARAKADESICALINSDGYGKSYENFCVYHVALLNKDPVLCMRLRLESQVFSQSDLCYYNLAMGEAAS